MSTLLKVENLKTYFNTRNGTLKAVDGIDLEIQEGQTLGIVGESGSGKSVTGLSIMRLIEEPGYIAPESRVWFREQDITGLSERELLGIRGNKISMIFQEPMTSLNPVYTVGEQIIEAVRLHRDVSRGAARDRAIEMLSLVGIPTPERRVDDYPHQLSGGMRQRAMIAMALSCDPKLLIADEPTTALDVTVQAQILDLLRELRERNNMAVMLITHDLGVVAEMCDEIAVMYAGQVVERGPVDQVLSRPQHPYSEALLQSIPLLGMTQAEPLKAIRGMVPSPLDWPEGCRFAARCDYAFQRCWSEIPDLMSTGSGGSACWLRHHEPSPVAALEAKREPGNA
jgi:oligopeptide/dipeptide ABC transporter ATP-binding protein